MSEETVYSELSSQSDVSGSIEAQDSSAAAEALAQGMAEGRLFKIRGADSAGQRSSANVLIRRRYAWRGYDAAALPATQKGDRITLTATDRNAMIGTVTVGLGGTEPLHAAETFPAEIAAMQAAGKKVCEFTKLAIDTQASSRHVLASLFHVAYLVAHRMRGHDTLLGEVNPRHVGYYRRQLGATIVGTERINTAVNAPSILLAIDFYEMGEQIKRWGGRSGVDEKGSRTLYPLFFSQAEEAGILGRLEREAW